MIMAAGYIAVCRMVCLLPHSLSPCQFLPAALPSSHILSYSFHFSSKHSLPSVLLHDVIYAGVRSSTPFLYFPTHGRFFNFRLYILSAGSRPGSQPYVLALTYLPSHPCMGICCSGSRQSSYFPYHSPCM